MEGNERNAFAKNPLSQTKDRNSSNISYPKNIGYGVFVEESTLRNVNLNEMDEASQARCSSQVDGNFRRASSAVSVGSEVPARLAFVLEWHNSYFLTRDGKLRVTILACCFLSALFVSAASTSEQDVLTMAFGPMVRLHIGVLFFTFFLALVFLLIHVTAFIQSLPYSWNHTDSFAHGICASLMLSSLLVLKGMYEFHVSEPRIVLWTNVMVTISSTFGIICALLLIILAVRRHLNNPIPAIENIRMMDIKHMPSGMFGV